MFAAFGFACGPPPPGRGAGEVEVSKSNAAEQKSTTFKVETVVGNLEVPWSIVWAPDGRMFFTERPGRVRVYENGKLRPAPFFTVPDVEQSGESGLMSMALHPQFAANRLMYLAYAYKAESQRVRVVRYRETPNGLLEPNVIIDNIPAAKFHAGCRIRFGPDAKLYITTGDATERSLAQRLDSLAGKTLRVNDDGTVPTDNPFVGQQMRVPRFGLMAIGMRRDLTGNRERILMFQTEHGPSGFDGPGGGDEVNIVEKGKNYGWPVIHHNETRAGMEAPLLNTRQRARPRVRSFLSRQRVSSVSRKLLFWLFAGHAHYSRRA